MKFDLDTAWRDTRRYLTENAGLLAIMSGIFVFLPYAAMLVLMPLVATMPQVPEGTNYEVAIDAMSAFYSEIWWMVLLVTIILTVGQLSILALIGRRPNPTVGEAIMIGGKAIFPAALALVLQSLAINFVVLAIILIASMTGAGAIVLLATVAALGFAFYLVTRFSLVLPIAAIEGSVNPIQMLSQSWNRTKGHGLRLLGFFVLIGVAGFVVSLVFTLVTGTILALFGASIAEAVGLIVSAALMAALVAVFTCVLAAVHQQLRRLSQSGGLTGPHTAPRDER